MLGICGWVWFQCQDLCLQFVGVENVDQFSLKIIRKCGIDKYVRSRYSVGTAVAFWMHIAFCSTVNTDYSAAIE